MDRFGCLCNVCNVENCHSAKSDVEVIAKSELIEELKQELSVKDGNTKDICFRIGFVRGFIDSYIGYNSNEKIQLSNMLEIFELV